MQNGWLRSVPALLLLIAGLAIVVWSGAAIYEEVAPSRAQYSYDATEAEELDGRVYQFNELSDGAQALTRTALEDEIPTRSPVPPEFVTNGSSDAASDEASDAPARMQPHVDYYVHYRGEFHRFGVSANETAVTVVEVAGYRLNEEFYTYASLTDRERAVVDRAIGSDSTIRGPDASELRHFDAESIEEGGRYVVYKGGQAYDLAVQKRGTGLRLWPLILVPVFLLGVAAVTIGAIGYWLSATAVPTSMLVGIAVLFGPPLLTELGVLPPMEEPEHLVVVAPLLAGATFLAFVVRLAVGDRSE